MYSCVSEDDVLQTEKTEQEKKVFSTFSQSSNLQGKNISATIDYAKGFAILMQRYDSIHKSNISGLVNTTNIVEYKNNSRQNVILENNDFYIETRLHSQTIFDKNGDIWIMYPKIKNKLVDGLLIASYTDNKTNVFFSYVKKDSELYISNVKLFQEKFDKQINNSINKKANGLDCGNEGQNPCDLDEVPITPNPGGSGSCSNCYTTPPENGGSGCSAFVDCIAPGGGGGGDGSPDLLGPLVVGPDVSIPDVKTFLECLNTNSNAKVSVYASQPIPNSSASHNGNNVGHAFISIQQGNQVKVIGFYPKSNWINPINPSGTGIYGNDSQEYYNVSITTDVNGSQLKNIIDYIYNHNGSTYNLNTYNCTDFAIDIGNLAGLNLPDSYGTWPGGGGSNPGALGEKIRSMPGSSKSGSNAPKSTKC